MGAEEKMSVTRYGWVQKLFGEAPEGEFVHFSDYQKLVAALRLIYRSENSSCFTKGIAEAALLSAGEEL